MVYRYVSLVDSVKAQFEEINYGIEFYIHTWEHMYLEGQGLDSKSVVASKVRQLIEYIFYTLLLKR